METTVPLAARSIPHMPFVQVRVWHSVSGPPEHSVESRHSTQAPTSLHLVPLFMLQATPAPKNGLEGTPAVQTLCTH